MKKIVLSGGWGYGNIGDEAIASSSIYLINTYFPEHKLIVTSYNPNNFKKQHSIEAIPSIHYMIEKMDFTKVKCVEDILNEVDETYLKEYEQLFDTETIFIMSGGGYFFEKWESQFWARTLEIYLALKNHAKVAVIGQSIGPICSQDKIEIVRELFEKVDYLSVRDVSSWKFIKEIIKNHQVKLSSDIAIVSSEVYEKSKKDGNILQINIMPASYDYYVAQNTPLKNKSKIQKIRKKLSIARVKYLCKYRQLFKWISKQDNMHINIVVSTEWSWNLKLINKLVKGIPKEKYTIHQNLTAVSFSNVLSKGDVVISTKLHPIIVSASYGVPGIAISYNFKVDDFMSSINRSDYCVRNDQFWKYDVNKAILKLVDKSQHTEVYNNVEKMKLSIKEMFCEMQNILQ